MHKHFLPVQSFFTLYRQAVAKLLTVCGHLLEGALAVLQAPLQNSFITIYHLVFFPPSLGVFDDVNTALNG
jgi:hypothetical protein